VTEASRSLGRQTLKKAAMFDWIIRKINLPKSSESKPRRGAKDDEREKGNRPSFGLPLNRGKKYSRQKQFLRGKTGERGVCASAVGPILRRKKRRLTTARRTAAL